MIPDARSPIGTTLTGKTRIGFKSCRIKWKGCSRRWRNCAKNCANGPEASRTEKREIRVLAPIRIEDRRAEQGVGARHFRVRSRSRLSDARLQVCEVPLGKRNPTRPVAPLIDGVGRLS